MSDDTANWLSFSALVLSGIGIAVSLLARRDSNRSTTAAEKSAATSERSASAAEKSATATEKSVGASEKSATASERSANAAEKSAYEAEKTRKLAYFNALQEHFATVDGYISAMKGERKIKNGDMYKALSAIDGLKVVCASDFTFIQVLEALRAPADELPGDGRAVTRLKDCVGYKDDYPLDLKAWAPKNISDLAEALRQARAKHLNIG